MALSGMYSPGESIFELVVRMSTKFRAEAAWSSLPSKGPIASPCHAGPLSTTSVCGQTPIFRPIKDKWEDFSRPLRFQAWLKAEEGMPIRSTPANGRSCPVSIARRSFNVSIFMPMAPHVDLKVNGYPSVAQKHLMISRPWNISRRYDSRSPPMGVRKGWGIKGQVSGDQIGMRRSTEAGSEAPNAGS